MNEAAFRTILKRLGMPVAQDPAPSDWLTAWRELAQITCGITGEDSRFEPVMVWLDRCDSAYLAGDWNSFQQAAEQVKMTAKKPCA